VYQRSLGLYISNLSKEKHNNWNKMLNEEMILAQRKIKQNARRYKLNLLFEVEKLYTDICFSVKTKNMSNCKIIHEIVDNMICIYIDYNDDFLVSKNDYLQLDYLINSFFKDNEYHFLKLYSLCQLFIDDKYSENLKNIISEKLRKKRNKIVHGDFISFEKLIEEYACKIMDNNFSFDYSEYSRKNWVILHICCELERVVRKMVNMLFLDRDKLENIRNDVN